MRGKRLGFTLEGTKETFDLDDDSARGEEAQLRYDLGCFAEKRNKLLRQRQDIDILGQKRRPRPTA